MEEKDKGEVKEQKGFKDYLVPTLILIAIVALGVLAVNQTLGYYYKAQLLKGPCELCKELNPEVRECFSYRMPGGVNPDLNLKEINLSNIIITSP